LCHYIDEVSKCSKLYRHSYAILYADDILLLASTVTLLDRLFAMCEAELTTLTWPLIQRNLAAYA